MLPAKVYAKFNYKEQAMNFTAYTYQLLGINCRAMQQLGLPGGRPCNLK